MGWIRLDDDFPNHPKVLAAGQDGMLLFVAGLCYCSQYQTDGRIPKAAINRLVAIRNPQAAAEQLVVVGLWDEDGGCYVVRKYLDYQRSKAEIDAIKEARREAGRRGGLAKQSAKQSASNLLSKPEASDVAKTYPHTHTQVDLPYQGERLDRCSVCATPLDSIGFCIECEVAYR